MSKPWYDLAASELDSEDSIQKSYSCSYDKGNGYLCLGKKRMVFVNVKGFLRKSYDVTLNIPYSDLKEVELAGRFKMNLRHNGSQHFVETGDLAAKLLMHAMQDVLKESPEFKVEFVENH